MSDESYGRLGAAASSGVRSLARAFDLLEHLADAGGALTLSELADVSGLPAPTIYRLMRTLVNQGYVRQEPSRRYALGPRLIRLGDTASRMLGSWARPWLSQLVDEIGETANLALLDGDRIVYVAQVPSRHSMRMFTEVGRSFPPHCTGVGKALLAQLPPDVVAGIVARTGMPAHTPRTITDPDELAVQLAGIRERGYAVDDGEQELGVRCVAVPVPDSATPTGLSVSGPEARLTDTTVSRVVPIMRAIAKNLAHSLTEPPSA